MRNITKLLTLVVLCLVGMQGNAQNVTLRGNNGSLIPAVKNGGTGDTFFRCGGSATYQHEQLCMVLTSSDGKVLTPNGQLDNPANNLFKSSDGKLLQIAHGQYAGNGDYTSTDDEAPSNVCFLSLSLPSGYRFTSYSIKFSRPADVYVGTTQPRNGTSYDVYLNPTQLHSGSDLHPQGYYNGSNYANANYGTGATTFGETDRSFDTYKTSASIAPNGSAVVIEREETETDPMGNVLYFKLSEPTYIRTMIQIEEAEFYFTSEENFTPLTPASPIADNAAKSAVYIPFSTSKVDYGEIGKQTYQGVERVSYSSANVKDLEANFVLYEYDSTTDGTDIDGISGKVVHFDEGSISSVGGYFKFTSPGTETKYCIETPTYVELSDGTKNPVGYRIVDVKYDYATSVTASRTFYITYTYNGTTYYLNTNGRFTTTQVLWEMDGEGFVSNGGRYLYFNNGRVATQTTKPSNSERFALDGSNNIYQTGWPTYYIRANVVTKEEWQYYHYVTVVDYIEGLINPDDDPKAVCNNITNTSSGNTGNFQFVPYDKEGNRLTPITVSGSGTYPPTGEDNPLSGLNNDAVMFGIIGTGLVRATLTLQALDPYLDFMEVVLRDDDVEDVRMWETFTASDFSVNGGEFFFHMPNDLLPELTAEDPYAHTTISFENLQSKYFDETYTNGHSANKSRLNFVQSQHYIAFTRTVENQDVNNIYNNRNEAKSATPESSRIAANNGAGQYVRTKVSTVGRTPFKFNNADEVTQVSGDDVAIYTEYPFSLKNYSDAPNNGSFYEMKFDVSRNSNDQYKTGYVFTTDETRYNIAPTTATQHRAYAYYEMTVHVQPATYSPTVTFEPIYAHTNYDNSDATNGSVDEDKAFYGAVVTAYYGENHEAGYASTTSIFKAIDEKIKAGPANSVPASAKEILYLDFSQLKGVYQITDDTHQSMEDYSASNAANCLIFLPEGHSASNNNVAFKQSTGSFMAANNIVLTDKQPFYSPYEIKVPSENYAMYTRNKTYSDYGKDVKAMVMLPFALTLEDGKHINPSVKVGTTETVQGDNSFWVKTMVQANLTDNPLTNPSPSPVGKDYGIAYFENVSDAKTAANTPYMVLVDEQSVKGDASFVAIEKGATIAATTSMTSRSGSGENGTYTYNYLFKGETVSGTTDVPGNSVTLTNEGSYSGQKYDRMDSEAIFYFADNRFYNLYRLNKNYQYLYAYPFHPVYSFSGSYSSVNSLLGLDITFEPFVVDYIQDVTKAYSPDLAVRSGKGFIQMTSDKNQTVDIRTLNGTSYSMVNMNAGDSKTVNLPAGVYLVNNVKIIVK